MDQRNNVRIVPSVHRQEKKRGQYSDVTAAALMNSYNHFSYRPRLVLKYLSLLLGVVFAYLLQDPPRENSAFGIVAGALSIFTVASAKSMLGEWLDRLDVYHPRNQAGATLSLCLFGLFAVAGLAVACQLGDTFLVTAVMFLVSGLIYDAPAVRLKDMRFLKVVSASVDNPILLTLGWVMIEASSLPLTRLVVACWAAGVFLLFWRALGIGEHIQVSR